MKTHDVRVRRFKRHIGLPDPVPNEVRQILERFGVRNAGESCPPEQGEITFGIRVCDLRKHMINQRSNVVAKRLQFFQALLKLSPTRERSGRELDRQVPGIDFIQDGTDAGTTPIDNGNTYVTI